MKTNFNARKKSGQNYYLVAGPALCNLSGDENQRFHEWVCALKKPAFEVPTPY
jgi:hypothetical protein